VYEPPQPSLTLAPQPLPAHAVACAVGVQHVPALQTCVDAHTDGVQATEPPQPSLAVPPHCEPHALAALLGVQQAAA
jgi:hypothetical protein